MSYNKASSYWNHGSRLDMVVKIDGVFYVLFENNWNGEKFFDCPVSVDENGFELTNETAAIIPVYGCEDKNGCRRIVDYKVC